jgi:hypothetical protein
MLQKLTIQNPKDPNRIWYSDEYFDLIIWQDRHNCIEAFQLCYDIKRHERVLSWSKTYGFNHSQIDSGEQSPNTNRSPLFVADGIFECQKLLEKFNKHAKDIDAHIRAFIIDKVKTYH